MNSLETVYAAHHKDEDRHSGLMHTGERGAFLRARVGQGKKVLDVGCRNGALTAFYAEGNMVLGVDIDIAALHKAKERIGIETKQLDLNGEWPFSPRSFDVVVATEVLEHLYFPERQVSKIATLLTEEGKLLGSVPNAFSLINRMRLLFGHKRYTPLGDPTHINHFSSTELYAILLKHFREVELVPLGNYAFLDRFFPGLFAFMYQFEARKPRQ